MSTQIARATEEQSAVAGEVNRNIDNIRSIGARTAEGAQQAALASESLSRLAQQLGRVVGQFKV